jgi:hypothetical protein
MENKTIVNVQMTEEFYNKVMNGGNAGGADSSSKYFVQYFKIPKGWNRATYARMFGVILKAEADGNLSIYPSNMVNNSIDSSIVAYGIMPNLPVSAPNTSAKNLKEYVDIMQPMLFTQTEITEEEFYTL